MTLRDRLVLTIVVALAIIGAAWVMVVSPERKQAKELDTQLTAAKAQLSTAEGQLASARNAQARYASAYASLVRLGKAVPTSQEMPSLIYQLAQASKEKNVDFNAITSSASGAGSGSSGAAAASAAAATVSTLPFTFVFSGSYSGLEHMLHTLTGLTSRTPSGTLQSNGRLLTIQSLKLAAGTEVGKQAPAGGMTATITASAYQLPAEAASTTAPGPSSLAPASSGTTRSPTAPAIVRVKP